MRQVGSPLYHSRDVGRRLIWSVEKVTVVEIAEPSLHILGVICPTPVDFLSTVEQDSCLALLKTYLIGQIITFPTPVRQQLG